LEHIKQKIAQELCILFQDEIDIPERFKKNGNNKTNKFKKDSLIENRFKEYLSSWLDTINIIFENVKDEQQAWRFIKINPKINKSDSSVTLNRDFLEFTDLLIFLRDTIKSESNEIGNLCALHTAFQKKIEKSLNNEK